MPKKITWVLIADGVRARLLANHGPGTGLTSALDQEFIGTNLPGREIDSDRPGRAFDSAGLGRHAMEPPTDPRRKAKEDFAREVASVLDDAAKRGAFDRLIVVAPPQALGDLRALFSDRVRDKVTDEINKDLTTVPVHNLPERLRDIFVP